MMDVPLLQSVHDTRLWIRCPKDHPPFYLRPW